MNIKINSRRLSREERMQQLIAVAAIVFAEKGYEASSVAEIARQAGVGEATAFKYFETKRDLLLHVTMDWYERMYREIKEGLTHIEGFELQLSFIIRFHLSVLVKYRDLCAVILTQARSVYDSVMREQLYQLNRSYIAPMRDLVIAGQHEGIVVKTVSPSFVTALVYGTCEHELWRSIERGIPIEIDRISRGLIVIVMNYLQGQNSGESLRHFADEVVLAKRLAHIETQLAEIAKRLTS